jgi:hypothetical protein
VAVLLGILLVDGHSKKKLGNVQEAMNSLVVPQELLTVTSGYGPLCIFYTDSSLIEGCAGFAVHQMGVGGFGHKIQSPAGVSLLSLVLNGTLLSLYGLWRDVLFSLVA